MVVLPFIIELYNVAVGSGGIGVSVGGATVGGDTVGGATVGVWKSKLELSRVSTVSDPERFIFVMNDTWDYQIKRKAGTADSVGLASQGWLDVYHCGLDRKDV